MNLHLFKFAPMTAVYSLRLLFNLKKQSVYHRFAYVNEGVTAKGALGAVNNLRIIFPVGGFNGLNHGIFAEIAQGQSNKT